MTIVTPDSCPYCGMWHTGTCVRISAIEYHANGTIKRVEFHPVAEQSGVYQGSPIVSPDDPKQRAEPRHGPLQGGSS